MGLYQGCFWEAIFLPQLDLSSLSKYQLVPSGSKHPVVAARVEGKGARRHGRDRHSPAGVSAGPGQRGQLDLALEHPLPQHAASCSGPVMRGSGPGNEPGKAQTLPTPAAPRAHAPLPGAGHERCPPAEQGFWGARDRAGTPSPVPCTPSGPAGQRSRPPDSERTPRAGSAPRSQLPAPGDILQESSTNMPQRDLGAAARQMNLCRNAAFVLKPPVQSA